MGYARTEKKRVKAGQGRRGEEGGGGRKLVIVGRRERKEELCAPSKGRAAQQHNDIK